MRHVLAALAMMGAAASAQAATVTFDGLPDEGEQLTEWREDGVLVTALGGTLTWFSRRDAAHLDDRGTPLAQALAFTMDRPFAARSVDIFPLPSGYVNCPTSEPEPDCPVLDFDNVLVEGFRGGEKVASAAFSMFDASPTYTFDASFQRLDRLVLGFAPVFEGQLPDGSYAICPDVPCTHFDVDNVTLAPIPLPATWGLMGLALAGLGLAARRRG